MPNYGLVVTPQYNPMSYEQYAKPFEDYAKVYNQMADTYDALEMEANQWEKLAQNAKDAPQYQQYKRYADDLRNAASDLADNGLSVRTRSTLSKLRKRYANEIKPIADAYEYRQKMAEEQRKLNPKGDMQFDVDFSNIGLDRIMANPSLGYKSRSLSEMEREGFEQAAAASSRRLISEKAKDMGNQYYRILQGYGAEDAARFLDSVRKENPTEYMELVDLYNQIRGSYGTNAEDSPYSPTQNALADDRILSGMLKGLSSKDSYQTNHWALPSATGKGSGSGSGSDNLFDGSEVIGYEAKVGNKRYTLVNEKGNYELYDRDTKQPYKPTAEEWKQIEKEGGIKPIPRYAIIPHSKSNTDKVTVYDLLSGMPVSQEGNNLTYDRNTQRWSPIKVTVEDIPGADPTKVPKANKPGYVVVSNSNGDTKHPENQTGYYRDFDDKSIPEDLPSISWKELTVAEKQALPDIIRQNPYGYIFKRKSKVEAKGFRTGTNDVVFYIPTTTAKAPASQNVSDKNVVNEIE